ncbi:MAG TPA: flagellar filament capping protein FliD, partial [Tepidisphaeraceae bacterium]|nr:flagellar filament capping protein FliD [Tepidisphaeraceae bacterium]
LPSTFAASTANSSDDTILTATAGAAAAVGSYNFNVASLVTSQQAISQGYSSENSLVGAGTISVSLGGGEASSQTTLAQLNGGSGVQRGQFRITDGSGNSAVIDISKAVTLDDVVNDINNSLDVSVRASVQDDHLVLQDASGQTKANFAVQDLGNGQSAAQLGIVGNTSGTTITGTNINTITADTPLAQLNDGRGVDSAAGASDFQVNVSNGSSFQVALGAAETVGDAINAINTAANGKATASLDAATNSITLTDNTGSAGLAVTELNNSSAAKDLGIANTVASSSIQGTTLLSSLDSVLVTSLNGGNGIQLGTIQIAAGAGTPVQVNLAGATSVQNIIDDINNAGAPVTASLNSSGDGIALTNNTGQSIVVSDADTKATSVALGIAGTFAATQTTIQGGALHAQYISNSTLLTSYNGGQGVDLGSFSITNSNGATSTVNLGNGTYKTIGDVIGAINAKGIGVTASINATGDGIQLTDTNGGPTKLQVANVNGTTATDLNIVGTATGTSINGSLTKSVTVSATDTLTTLQQKIAALGYGVSANIVNDGTGQNGYHLSLTAQNSGLNGRVVIDTGTTNVKTTNVVNAQNAAVFYGGANSSQDLLVTSSTNQLTGIVPGVTIQLQGTGDATLNVTRDASAISNQLQTFTTTFNDLVQEAATLTTWNSNTNQAGLLLGDSTIQDVQQQIYDVFDSVVQGAGQYKLLSDLGLTINGDGSITYDQNKFNAAYASDPTAVQNLFTQTTTGLGTVLTNSMTHLIDPVNGELTLTENTLTSQVQGFQDNVNQLNAVLSDQRTVLENQFANMETVLAQLQSQGQALSSIGTIGATTTKSSTSNSSSTSGSSSSTSSSG